MLIPYAYSMTKHSETNGNCTCRRVEIIYLKLSKEIIDWKHKHGITLSFIYHNYPPPTRLLPHHILLNPICSNAGVEFAF